jgi:predicted ribosomally synthesized peptide with nif11-like leader
MSTEGANALFERVSNDQEFRRRLEESRTADDKRRIVAEAGFDVNRDDVATMKSLAGLDEMSDEELVQAVGGSGAGSCQILRSEGQNSVLGAGALAVAGMMSG